MINAQAKKEIIFFISFCSLVLPVIMLTNRWLNTSKTYTIHASETLKVKEDIDSLPEVINTSAEGDSVPGGEVGQYSSAPLTVSQVAELIVERFGYKEEAADALAIAQAESGLDTTKENKTSAECSIGLFQINLARDYCNGTWVHAGKVPGDTMEEKIEWLKVPENNIEIAKQIHRTSGFYPWSVFLNGVYEIFK